MNIISDLSHPQAYGGGSATANHNRSAATFLSGAHAEAGPQAHLGITMDQFAAQKIGQDTPLPSLELMIEDATLSCGDGLSCAYRDTISWQSAHLAAADAEQPAGGLRAAVRGRQHRCGTSRAPATVAQPARFRARRGLGAADPPAGGRPRAAWSSISATSARSSAGFRRPRSRRRWILSLPDAPAGAPKDVDQHIKLMFDLQVLAWQADITRVTTMLLAKELSNAVYREERRARRVPHPLAPFEHPREPGSVRGAQPVSRRPAGVSARASSRQSPTATARCSITRWCCTAAR